MLTDLKGNRYGWRGALIFPDEYFGPPSPTAQPVYVGVEPVERMYLGATLVTDTGP